MISSLTTPWSATWANGVPQVVGSTLMNRMSAPPPLCMAMRMSRSTIALLVVGMRNAKHDEDWSDALPVRVTVFAGVAVAVSSWCARETSAAVVPVVPTISVSDAAA